MSSRLPHGRQLSKPYITVVGSSNVSPIPKEGRFGQGYTFDVRVSNNKITREN